MCVKFNNWKLTTSLFLLFHEDSAIIFCQHVQRTELWLMILKTNVPLKIQWYISKNATFHLFVSRIHSYLPSEIHTLSLKWLV